MNVEHHRILHSLPILTFLSTSSPCIFLSFFYLLCLLLCSLLHFDDLQRQELIDARTENYKAESTRKTGYVGKRENKKTDQVIKAR
jgi:hypothetical protein